MAHIRKQTWATKGGEKHFRYYVIFKDPKGKQHKRGGFKIKKDAEAARKLIEAQLADGTYGKDEAATLTFGEFYSRWIKTKRKSLKPATLDDYERTFKLHVLPFFAGRGIDSLNPLTVQEWIDSLDTSPATTSKCYRYFRACIRQAVTWGVIEKNPCRGIELPRHNGEELSYLQPPEIVSLLQECRDKERILFTLLAYSGLRLGEGLALRWRDIDFNMNAIKVTRSYSILNGFTEPKTSAGRRAVPLLPSLAEYLKDYYVEQVEPAPDALLFTENGETPMDKGNCRRRFYLALEAAKLKHVSIHSVRHTFASVMLESGASIKVLANCLGHSSPAVTLRIYSHLISESAEPVLLKADALMTGANGKRTQLSKRERIVSGKSDGK